MPRDTSIGVFESSQILEREKTVKKYMFFQCGRYSWASYLWNGLQRATNLQVFFSGSWRQPHSASYVPTYIRILNTWLCIRISKLFNFNVIVKLLTLLMSPNRTKHMYSCKNKEKWYQNLKNISTYMHVYFFQEMIWILLFFFSILPWRWIVRVWDFKKFAQ